MRVAGLGFRSTAKAADLCAALALLPCRVDVVASLEHKVTTDAFAAAIGGATPHPLAPAQLRCVETPTNSPRIQVEFGTGSIAEACALVAARSLAPKGTTVHLVQTRCVTPGGQATVALAEIKET